MKKSSINKSSLFPDLNKGKSSTHTCLKAKEGKRKVKAKSSSSPKYVSSDDDDDDENNDSDDES